MLSQAVQDEMAETTARVVWNITRSGANATNAAVIREGGVGACLAYCTYDGGKIQVSAWSLSTTRVVSAFSVVHHSSFIIHH